MPKYNNLIKNLPEETFGLPKPSSASKNGKPSNVQNSGNTSVFIRDNRTAARVFGLYDRTLERLPRQKFLFYVNFVIPDRKNFGQPYTGWDTGVSLAVKSVTRPSLSFDTRTLNQYNKKRIAKNRVNFENITIELYDTRDQRVFKMFKDYYDFYYGDATAETLDWLYDTTMVDYHYPANAKDFGFNPPDTIPDQAYFFDRIEIYEFNQDKYNKYSLIKPVINNFSYDTNDYNDSSPQLIRLTFSYEGVVWEKINEKISDEIIEESGRGLGDFYDIAIQHLNLEARNRKELLKNIDIQDFSPKNLKKISPPEQFTEYKTRLLSGKSPLKSKTSLLNGEFSFAIKNVLTRTIANAARGAENILENIENIPITDIITNPKIIKKAISVKGLKEGLINDIKLTANREVNNLFQRNIRKIIDPVTKKIINVENTIIDGIRGSIVSDTENFSTERTISTNPETGDELSKNYQSAKNVFGKKIKGLLNQIQSVKNGKTKKSHIDWFLSESDTVSRGRKTESANKAETLTRRTIESILT